jgi:hypothetical protein
MLNDLYHRIKLHASSFLPSALIGLIVFTLACKKAAKEESLSIPTAPYSLKDISLYQKQAFDVITDSLKTVPAIITTIPAGKPKIIPVTAIKTTIKGVPRIIKIDTSKLVVKTPGQAGASDPIVYTLPEPVERTVTQQLDAHNYTEQHGFWILAPVKKRIKHPEPVPISPMRMKESAVSNIQYLNIEQGLKVPKVQTIYEDRLGNMWFGFRGTAICRYDGKSCIYYTQKDGIDISADVWAIAGDHEGNI